MDEINPTSILPANISEEFRDRIRNYESEVALLQEKYALRPETVMRFPELTNMDPELQLALLVLKRYGQSFATIYSDLVLEAEGK